MSDSKNLKLHEAWWYLIAGGFQITTHSSGHFSIDVEPVQNVKFYCDWGGVSHCVGRLIKAGKLSPDFIYEFEDFIVWHRLYMHHLPEKVIKRNKLNLDSFDWTPPQVRDRLEIKGMKY